MSNINNNDTPRENCLDYDYLTADSLFPKDSFHIDYSAFEQGYMSLLDSLKKNISEELDGYKHYLSNEPELLNLLSEMSTWADLLYYECNHLKSAIDEDFIKPLVLIDDRIQMFYGYSRNYILNNAKNDIYIGYASSDLDPGTGAHKVYEDVISELADFGLISTKNIGSGNSWNLLMGNVNNNPTLTDGYIQELYLTGLYKYCNLNSYTADELSQTTFLGVSLSNIYDSFNSRFDGGMEGYWKQEGYKFEFSLISAGAEYLMGDAEGTYLDLLDTNPELFNEIEAFQNSRSSRINEALAEDWGDYTGWDVLGTIVFSVTEGFLKVGEGVFDGLLMLSVGTTGHFLDFDTTWCSDIIKYDVSGFLYDSAISLTGINQDVAYSWVHDISLSGGEMIGMAVLSNVPVVGSYLKFLSRYGMTSESMLLSGASFDDAWLGALIKTGADQLADLVGDKLGDIDYDDWMMSLLATGGNATIHFGADVLGSYADYSAYSKYMTDENGYPLSFLDYMRITGGWQSAFVNAGDAAIETAGKQWKKYHSGNEDIPNPKKDGADIDTNLDADLNQSDVMYEDTSSDGVKVASAFEDTSSDIVKPDVDVTLDTDLGDSTPTSQVLSNADRAQSIISDTNRETEFRSRLRSAGLSETEIDNAVVSRNNWINKYALSRDDSHWNSDDFSDRVEAAELSALESYQTGLAVDVCTPFDRSSVPKGMRPGAISGYRAGDILSSDDVVRQNTKDRIIADMIASGYTPSGAERKYFELCGRCRDGLVECYLDDSGIDHKIRAALVGGNGFDGRINTNGHSDLFVTVLPKGLTSLDDAQRTLAVTGWKTHLYRGTFEITPDTYINFSTGNEDSANASWFWGTKTLSKNGATDLVLYDYKIDLDNYRQID